MKNYEQYKRIIRFAFFLTVLSLEMASYWYVWKHFYNPLMENPYNRTGHWLMIAVYGILLVLFNALYGGLKVGYLKTGNMIYSQTLAGLSANAMIYLQITLLTKHFQTVLPLLAMSAAEFFIICVWSFLSTRIYRLLYPPRKVLLIYGEHPVASLMGKIHTRNDRFVIGEIVHIPAGTEKISQAVRAGWREDAYGMEGTSRAEGTGEQDRISFVEEAGGQKRTSLVDRAGGQDRTSPVEEVGGQDRTSLMDRAGGQEDRNGIGRASGMEEPNAMDKAGITAIKEKIEKYEGVVICDIPSQVRNVILKYCYQRSIRTYTTPKISDILIRSSESLHLFDTPLLLSRNHGLSFEQRIMKRGMDVVLSLAALFLLSPVFLITAAAIKLYDKGPVFYFQERCTKDGKVFRICKFRSMVEDAEKEGHSIPATDEDPRITPVGRIIRATRIDELPQILNILKGDMSIVGPRPERVEHVELYTRQIPEFRYRMKVKGGLTGYAQVYGKYNTSAYDKLKLDLMYIQNYSLMMDVGIIFKTVKVLFMKESTEGFVEEFSAAMENGAILQERGQKKDFF